MVHMEKSGGRWLSGSDMNLMFCICIKPKVFTNRKTKFQPTWIDKHLGDKTLWNRSMDNLSASEQNGTSNLPIQPAVKWKDVNGDGGIDQYDRVKVGNTGSALTGGFNTTLRWKGLQLYARFDFAPSTPDL